MYQKDRHCSFCGTRFLDHLTWPRRCAYCGNVSYKNPLPVAVLLLPVDDGVLVIRRGIAPHLGELALPGGFIEWKESWQDAAARELYEETGITVDPATISSYQVHSTSDGMLLIFGVGERVAAADLPPFTPTPECSERMIVTAPVSLAFPLHTAVLSDFFNK